MPSELTPQQRQQIEDTIRFLAVDAVERAKSGHPGAPMGLAAAALELFDHHLRFDPSDPAWPLRDRFVLSGGHASMLLYSLLHLFGYDLELEQIERFRQLGSRTPGHPEYGLTPGVELTTGPLGQGFAHGVGMALAARMTRAHFSGAGAGAGAGTGAADEGVEGGPGEHFVYGIFGDGDLMEGISAEAGSLAGHLGLGNLIYLYDDNQVTIDGPTALCLSEDVRGRFEAQRWHVQGPVDGQDVTGLGEALAAARAATERPSLIVLRTRIGRGSPGVEGKNKAHGSPLGEEEVRRTKQALGWPLDPPFLVPEPVRKYCAERAETKKQERAAIDSRHQCWREAHAEEARAWDEARQRRWPERLAEQLVAEVEGVEAATRKHSAAVLQKLAELVPFVVGGSADLAASAAPPLLRDAGTVASALDGAPTDRFAGRNIHFGVREHAMGAIANGIALDGTFVPYCGTFLIFSDYMRPALRLAALMRVRSIFVFTHDSFFVGEDGPTHQPIEQLDSLRLIPNLTLFRPADGVETAMAWAFALERAEGPTVFSLTRQKLPALERPNGFDPADVYKGAYAIRACQGRPDVVLMASGSEVALACAAAERLGAQGLAARVVSVPSLERFLAQSPAYQCELVPDDGTPVVAIEASRAESFRRFVGRNGLLCAMTGFGASAPAGELAEHFGFTPESVTRRILAHLGRGAA